jgi:hypothetical protein
MVGQNSDWEREPDGEAFDPEILRSEMLPRAAKYPDY